MAFLHAFYTGNFFFFLTAVPVLLQRYNKLFFINVVVQLFSVRSDFYSSAAPYLHKLVLWKAAGVETDQPQNSPWLVKSQTCIKLRATSGCLTVPYIIFNVQHWLYMSFPYADSFQIVSTCFTGFGLQSFKKMYLYLRAEHSEVELHPQILPGQTLYAAVQGHNLQGDTHCDSMLIAPATAEMSSLG